MWENVKKPLDYKTHLNNMNLIFSLLTFCQSFDFFFEEYTVKAKFAYVRNGNNMTFDVEHNNASFSKHLWHLVYDLSWI